MTESDAAFLTTRQVRERYGNVSHMWVERRLKDDSKFPQPMYISTRRYWRLNELIEWERSVVRKGARND